MEPSQENNHRGFGNIVPGAFTMGNLVCGFLAILAVTEGEIITACWLVILAAFLDLLDGKVARLSGYTSKFGLELDSLADFLSFGIAPAVLVHTIKLKGMGNWGWIIGIVYIMAASFRLARYNLMSQSDEKKCFVGLPAPAAALAMVTFIIFSYEIWGDLQYSEYLVSMVIGFAALMVSQVEFEMVPDRLKGKSGRIVSIIILIIVVGAVINAKLTLFPIIALYILGFMAREMIRLFSKGVEKARGRGSQDGNTSDSD